MSSSFKCSSFSALQFGPMARFYSILIFTLTLTGCLNTTEVKAPSPIEVSAAQLFEWSADRIPLISAHRGGSYPGYPENCLETFDYIANKYPVLIECDVARAADGTLILMHDETLDRTTTGQGKVSSYDWAQLRELRLKDDQSKTTSFSIPKLHEVLEWSQGRAMLSLDIKRSVAFEDVVDMVEHYEAQDRVVLITYTLGAAQKLHRLNKQLMLSVTVRNLEEFERLKASGIPLSRVMAFTGTSEPSLELYRALHEAGIYSILGTLGNLDRRAKARGDQIYLDFVERGADILATDRPLEVGEVLSSKYPLQEVFQKPSNP